MYKKSILYLNIFLFIVVALMAVNSFSVRGHELIRTALAAAGITSDGGTVNYLSRFVGAAGTSQVIGQSIIYDNGTNVGIGPTPPDIKLHISAPGGGGIKFDDTNNTNAWWIRPNGNGAQFVIGNMDNTSDANIKLIMDYSGNVGIGMAPDHDLVVKQKSSSHTNGGIALYRVNGTSKSSLLQGDDNNAYIWNHSSSGGIRFVAGNDITQAKVIFLNSAGDVGIGTNAPGAKLEVSGAMKLTPLSGNPSGLTSGMMWMVQ